MCVCVCVSSMSCFLCVPFPLRPALSSVASARDWLSDVVGGGALGAPEGGWGLWNGWVAEASVRNSVPQTWVPQDSVSKSASRNRLPKQSVKKVSGKIRSEIRVSKKCQPKSDRKSECQKSIKNISDDRTKLSNNIRLSQHISKTCWKHINTQTNN